jgi:hypothetical protein
VSVNGFPPRTAFTVQVSAAKTGRGRRSERERRTRPGSADRVIDSLHAPRQGGGVPGIFLHSMFGEVSVTDSSAVFAHLGEGYSSPSGNP